MYTVLRSLLQQLLVDLPNSLLFALLTLSRPWRLPAEARGAAFYGRRKKAGRASSSFQQCGSWEQPVFTSGWCIGWYSARHSTRQGSWLMTVAYQPFFFCSKCFHISWRTGLSQCSSLLVVEMEHLLLQRIGLYLEGKSQAVLEKLWQQRFKTWLSVSLHKGKMHQKLLICH